MPNANVKLNKAALAEAEELDDDIEQGDNENETEVIDTFDNE